MSGISGFAKACATEHLLPSLLPLRASLRDGSAFVMRSQWTGIETALMATLRLNVAHGWQAIYPVHPLIVVQLRWSI